MPKLLTVGLWVAIGALGAVGFGVLALSRGESINAGWIIVAGVCTYLVAYRFYSRFLAETVFGLDNRRATPAERLNNGRDFHPTNRWVAAGHHFSAISGAGPLVGPTLAAQFGYLPGTLWLIIGVVLGGAVQDFVILFASLRRDGKSLGQIAKEEVNPVAGFAAMAALWPPSTAGTASVSIGSSGSMQMRTGSCGFWTRPSPPIERPVHPRPAALHAKYVGWDTKTNTLFKVIDLDAVTLPQSQHNDFAIDLKHGALILADEAIGENSNGVGSTAALVVTNIANGTSRRVLQGDAHVIPNSDPIRWIARLGSRPRRGACGSASMASRSTRTRSGSTSHR